MLADEREHLGAPISRPQQIFAIGVSYVDHAAESGFEAPSEPLVFTKFASSLADPFGVLELPGRSVDWEVEFVAVFGRHARNVSADSAWDYVAGLCVRQDYSGRDLQMRVPPAQFSLGKSYAGFAPLGPALVTPDEIRDIDEMLVECLIDGEIMQLARASDMVFLIPELVQYLSSVCTLMPGDLIFTGTPPGVGLGRSPQRYLRDGEVVTSRIDGLGFIEQTCGEPAPRRGTLMDD